MVKGVPSTYLSSFITYYLYTYFFQCVEKNQSNRNESLYSKFINLKLYLMKNQITV